MNKNRHSGIIFAQLLRLNSISAKKSYFCADIPDTRQTIPEFGNNMKLSREKIVQQAAPALLLRRGSGLTPYQNKFHRTWEAAA